jgi:uncharacterized protein involved in tolerance to divalent cations
MQKGQGESWKAHIRGGNLHAANVCLYDEWILALRFNKKSLQNSQYQIKDRVKYDVPRCHVSRIPSQESVYLQLLG